MKQIKILQPTGALRLGVDTRRNRSASPLGSKTMTTSPRRMSWVISSSARRVLPTRVVPNTSVCPTRSPRSIHTGCSCGSTACRAGLPPTAGSGANGFQRLRLRRALASKDRTESIPRPLPLSRPLVERARLNVTLNLGLQGIAQALGVLLGPAKAFAQKQLMATDGIWLARTW